MISGEMDWWRSPTPDLIGHLRRQARLASQVQDPAGGIGILRFNHLFPPFDNQDIRRALLGAVD